MRKQKASLSQQQANLKILLNTIDNTIRHLNQEIMLNPEDLYHGLKKGTAQQYREEAIKKYGRTSVEKSEHALIDLGKNGFRALVTKQKDNAQKLYSLRNLDPKDEEVQKEMEEHYQIIRQFWAKDKADAQLAEAYIGLGQLYLSDERFTMIEDQPQPEYTRFLAEAMRYFANVKLTRMDH